MFKRVMWATDGSEASDKTLEHVKALVSELGSELLVVYNEEFTMPGKGGGSLPVHADEEVVQDKINRQVEELSKDGVSVRLEITKSKVGNAAHQHSRGRREPAGRPHRRRHPGPHIPAGIAPRERNATVAPDRALPGVVDTDPARGDRIVGVAASTLRGEISN